MISTLPWREAAGSSSAHALTRIYDLTLHSRSRATSTFYDDLADLLFQTADEERIQRDQLLPDLPNAEAYPAGGCPRRS